MQERSNKAKSMYNKAIANIKKHYQEESYTSLSSFFDYDVITIYKENDTNIYTFSTNRNKRGRYITKDNKIINANVKGALNI